MSIIIHNSRISDDEELRFQLGVAVYGLELGQHSGGAAYRWGDKSLLLRRGVRMRLVNVGVAEVIKGRNRFGYPAVHHLWPERFAAVIRGPARELS